MPLVNLGLVFSVFFMRYPEKKKKQETVDIIEYASLVKTKN